MLILPRCLDLGEPSEKITWQTAAVIIYLINLRNPFYVPAKHWNLVKLPATLIIKVVYGEPSP